MINANLNINGAKKRAAIAAEVKAYIDGLVTPLSLSQVKLIDTFVKDVKSGLGINNLSDAFDVMYILANETEESSLRNLVKRAHDATAVNSPTFTALEGWTNDGASSRLSSNYNASTQAVNYKQNSASGGIYSRSNIAENTADFGALSLNNRMYIFSLRTDNNTRYVANDNSVIDVANNSSLGMFIVSRTAAESRQLYKNKTLLHTGAIASVGVPNDIFTFGALLALGSYSTKQLSFGFLAKGLDQSDINVVYDSFQKYMTSNGKQV